MVSLIFTAEDENIFLSKVWLFSVVRLQREPPTGLSILPRLSYVPGLRNIKVLLELTTSRNLFFIDNPVYCFTKTIVTMLDNWFTLAILILITFLVINTYREYIRLSHIPGPFLAKLTNFQRAYWVWGRRAHETHIGLHEQYGKLVRCGPNMVSVGSSLEIDKIYKMRSPLQKVRSRAFFITF